MRDVLITAGATRNPIDAMRFISAHSTGRTGAWLAGALEGTHSVTVLGVLEALAHCPPAVAQEAYTSTDNLMTKMRTWVDAHPDGLVIRGGGRRLRGRPDRRQDRLGARHAHAHAEAHAEDPGRDPRVVPECSNRLVQGGAPRRMRLRLKPSRRRRVRTDSVAVFANVIEQLECGVLIWTRDTVQRFDHRAEALASLVSLVKTV